MRIDPLSTKIKELRSEAQNKVRNFLPLHALNSRLIVLEYIGFLI